MAIRHFNYYPPPGSVLDENEPKAYWDGKNWQLNKKRYAVPAGHSLIGRPKGPLDGWRYDWSARAWMEPDTSPPAASSSKALVHRSRPMPIAAPSATSVAKEESKVDKDSKDKTVLDYLIKHPIAPVVGGLVLIGSMLADEPAPPTIPAGLPEAVQKEWMMLYAQNQQRFARRQYIWDLVGKTLLGYSDTNAILAALPARKAA